MSNDLETRLDRLEAAFGRTAGINLSEFDGQAITAAREARIHEAATVAANAIQAAVEANLEPLTVEERVARIEKAVNSHFRA